MEPIKLKELRNIHHMKQHERAEGALTVAECDVCAGAGQDKVFVSDDTGGEGRAETVL